MSLETKTPENEPDTGYYFEDDYALTLKRNETEDVDLRYWYSTGIYRGSDGSSIVRVTETPIAVAPGEQHGHEATPLPEFFQDVSALVDTRNAPYMPPYERMGYHLLKTQSPDGSITVGADTPEKPARDDILAEIRAKTGFALQIEVAPEVEETGGFVLSKHMTAGLKKHVLYISNESRFEAHDMITHAPVWMLLTESAIDRIADKSEGHIQKYEGTPNDAAIREAYAAHFDAIEEVVSIRSFSQILRVASYSRELGVAQLAEQLEKICRFSEGHHGKQEARDEAAAILDRVAQINDIFDS
jgi:hypothetical protein